MCLQSEGRKKGSLEEHGIIGNMGNGFKKIPLVNGHRTRRIIITGTGLGGSIMIRCGTVRLMAFEVRGDVDLRDAAYPMN